MEQDRPKKLLVILVLILSMITACFALLDIPNVEEESVPAPAARTKGSDSGAGMSEGRAGEETGGAAPFESQTVDLAIWPDAANDDFAPSDAGGAASYGMSAGNDMSESRPAGAVAGDYRPFYLLAGLASLIAAVFTIFRKTFRKR